MALRKDVTRQLDLPHEPGEYVTVRLPGYHDLNRAREVRLFKQIRFMRELGSQPRVESPPPDPDAPVVPVDPLAAFDLDTLLETCIAGWSYPDKVTPDTIHSLDEVTAEYVGRQLVVQPESEAAQKND